MHDGRVVRVQVVQAAEDLPGPRLDRTQIQVGLELRRVLFERLRARLGDEIDAHLLGHLVGHDPAVVQLDDVLVVQVFEDLHLAHEPHTLILGQPHQPHLVPSHVHTLLLVERRIHVLVRPTPQELGGPPKAPRRVPLHKLGLLVFLFVFRRLDRVVVVGGLGVLATVRSTYHIGRHRRRPSSSSKKYFLQPAAKFSGSLRLGFAGF
mmetsp:Transcript_7043/g.11033  ORF Transcript_7043/g.11033 Transcript_7043/m.11033 type:complete len:207 (+) Transcript_7043:526-1146(+)